ncbi:MAG: dihydroorotate dehydrogenase [Zetaproteobacteria bacterium CG12_big_fil_rev_8_21_14_0_65_55_1124]|nr:MAG: dihydroorotate dehydrogenase [Zetaproteobacteria bacterium CG1_02_55_237]PIS18817.1 MAG: dihydroorotate dehydrogenase [Zetaproteobacteria bacterium CG08_land_8_20_14_0_20_55_17]PIW43933.1 MAG: dihydroorotate dehydrogenase [Zetaproteobacteria bacterium CG12_big_fil_rev_8_21_14_0_65_55_1124]PIY54498.1 MAG: dihydroorotate dehydrogenase [Zetaproteobacteria bacterium CG_4_10_14_0_8_um_filter_55_43]PIZ38252.1 MAG: dihydroorotate dehydrogenase [Zetaproteobacteria bacterium CG_4_10_14_0_2_um_fi
MIDLSTDYLGMKLKNPLVPSASPLARNPDSAKQLEDAGAAAIVMNSLFEEEVTEDEERLDHLMHHQDIGHFEAASYLPADDAYKTHLESYLEQLEGLKKSLGIPVIASLNGITASGWVQHAKELQQAGADALELNVYYMPADLTQSADAIEARYVTILSALKMRVDIPIIMKLSSQFSSVAHFVKKLEAAGANGVSLFNRYYLPDIDLETLDVVPSLKLSSSVESRLSMRWIAMLYGRVNLTLAATSGIHTSDDAIKMLLAGADVTHMCSALLQRGPAYLGEVLKGIEQWMEEKEYASITQLKGSVSHAKASDPTAFERSNYIKVLNSFDAPDGVWR